MPRLSLAKQPFRETSNSQRTEKGQRCATSRMRRGNCGEALHQPQRQQLRRRQRLLPFGQLHNEIQSCYQRRGCSHAGLRQSAPRTACRHLPRRVGRTVWTAKGSLRNIGFARVYPQSLCRSAGRTYGFDDYSCLPSGKQRHETHQGDCSRLGSRHQSRIGRRVRTRCCGGEKHARRYR